MGAGKFSQTSADLLRAGQHRNAETVDDRELGIVDDRGRRLGQLKVAGELGEFARQTVS